MGLLQEQVTRTAVICRAGSAGLQVHDAEKERLAYETKEQLLPTQRQQPLPLLGLAQLSLLPGHAQGQHAAALVESALAVQPAWVDAIQVRLQW